MKSLAGLFSIYLGFGATYLLLSKFRIVETMDFIIEEPSDVGIVAPPISDLQISILMQIS